MQKTFTPVTLSNTPSILTSAGVALAANLPVGRNSWSIQNLGTNPLFVLLGTGASTSVFHIILKGSSQADDGSGGIYEQNGGGAVYQGIVTVAGTSPRFVVMEL